MFKVWGIGNGCKNTISSPLHSCNLNGKINRHCNKHAAVAKKIQEEEIGAHKVNLKEMEIVKYKSRVFVPVPIFFSPFRPSLLVAL